MAGEKTRAGIGGEVGAALANPPDVHREGWGCQALVATKAEAAASQNPPQRS